MERLEKIKKQTESVKMRKKARRTLIDCENYQKLSGEVGMELVKAQQSFPSFADKQALADIEKILGGGGV